MSLNRNQHFPQEGPDGPVDVISVLNPLKRWVDYRKDRFGDVLRENGISHGCLTSPHLIGLGAGILKCRPRILLNEAWHVSPAVIAELAAEFPETKFVSLFHGSPVSIDGMSPWPEWHRAFMNLSKDRENCFYGHVMDDNRIPASPGAKVVAIPNIARLPHGMKKIDRHPDYPPHILISGRSTFTKNFTSQIYGVIQLHRILKTGVYVHIMTDAPADEMSVHTDTLDDFEVPWKHHQLDAWSAYMHWMSGMIHLNFCVSLTESFGLIAMESLLMGIPVVGSAAIEFLPDAWKANPQDPMNMAVIAAEILQDYKTASRLSVSTSARVCADNERVLIKNIVGLLA